MKKTKIKQILPKLYSRKTAAMFLAGLVMLICSIWYTPKNGVVLAALFVAAGFLNIKVENKWIRFLINGIWGILCIFLSCWIPNRMVAQTGFLDIGLYRVVMNLICAAVVYGICLVVTGEIKSAVAVASGLLLLLATVNGFVFQFRGNEFKPTDIYAAKTAWNVAGQYAWNISWSMVSCWLLWLWSVFFLGSLPSAGKILPGLWMRIGAAAAAGLCFAVLLYGYRVIHPNNWSNGGTSENGYYLNFAVNIRDAMIREPDGYSKHTMEELEEAYGSTPETPEKKPNIVIIMSESFADPRVLGSDLNTNQSVMPFIDSLRENTIRGYALTSVFGGVTANAEFELLTGSTMGFLPDGSVPYQQYIHEDCFSLARVLKDQGYTAFATHPYFSSGWSRTTVYPYFGFDKMTFIEDYPGEEMVREYLSDREMYHYILNALEEKEDAPLFLFGISMQNHGDYIYAGENYQQTIFLEGYREEYPMAEQYLSLLRETDEATGEFIRALENSQEDTVVLFFGDHFPQIESSFYEEVLGDSFDSLQQQMLQYSVPFFVWANFDIPEQTVECTSLNYLPRYLLEAAGIPPPPYYQFLRDLEAQIPAVNAMGYYSLSQGTYLPLEEAEGEESVWLNRYEMLQYNHWFDIKDRSQLFFSQYLPNTK